MDRPTGQIIHRNERSRPGELVHVDIKKLGSIPGGGHRVTPRQKITASRQATTDSRKNSDPVIGYSSIPTAIDDHPRLSSSEIRAWCSRTSGGWRRLGRFELLGGRARSAAVLT
jgi:hypothetical protein